MPIMLSVTTVSFTMLSVVFAESHYAECHLAKCHGTISTTNYCDAPIYYFDLLFGFREVAAER
jgi:hypothetical protein